LGQIKKKKNKPPHPQNAIKRTWEKERGGPGFGGTQKCEQVERFVTPETIRERLNSKILGNFRVRGGQRGKTKEGEKMRKPDQDVFHAIIL